MQVTVSFIVDVAASADINQIEQRVQEAGKPPMREAIGKAVRTVEEHKKVCPHCAGTDLRSEETDRRIVLTKFGRVVLALRRMRCQGCGRRFRPADDCLRSLAGGNITAQLREACIQAGAS